MINVSRVLIMWQRTFCHFWTPGPCVLLEPSAKNGPESSLKECCGRNWSRGKLILIVYGRDLQTDEGKKSSFDVSIYWQFFFSWIQYLFKPKPGESHPPHSFYRRLYPSIIKDIDTIEDNWRCGKHNLQRINCRSENSKGVYCLQVTTPIIHQLHAFHTLYHS